MQGRLNLAIHRSAAPLSAVSSPMVNPYKVSLEEYKLIRSWRLVRRNHTDVFYWTDFHCRVHRYCNHWTRSSTLFLVHFPPYWRSDLLPAICIVFKEPIRIAPQTDLSRDARQACTVRNEDSRYENDFKSDLSRVVRFPTAGQGEWRPWVWEWWLYDFHINM